MDFYKISEEEVEDANKAPELAPGYYPAVMTIVELGLTKGGMPRMTVDLRPLAEEGNRASGVSRFQQRKGVNVPVLTDYDTYLNHCMERLENEEKFATANAGLDGEALVQSALKSHRSFALNLKGDMVNVARLIFGEEVIPRIPEFNASRKSYLDAHGNVFSKDAVLSMSKGLGARAAELLAKGITEGELNGIYDCVIFKPENKKEINILSFLPSGKEFSEFLSPADVPF